MFWKGPVFTKNGFVDQTIDLQSCTVSDGFEEEADGILVPLFRNCHTHLGDTLARDSVPPNLSLAELVGPSGWKHKWLEDNNVGKSIIAGFKEVINSGTGLVMDFREGGVEGLKLLDDIEYPGTLIALGRPAGDDQLPGNHAGISSLVDVKNSIDLASQAREKNGFVGIHHSENEREDIEAVIDLKPDFLVHMCHASDSDLQKARDAGISIVVCPRSNNYFGNKPPIEKMVELGIDLGFGTDNGMLCTSNILDEIRFVRENFQNLELKTILSIACFGLTDMFNKDATSTYSNLEQSGWVLLSKVEEDNYESVFNPNTEILGVRWRN